MYSMHPRTQAFPTEFSLEVFTNYKLVMRALTVFNLLVIMPILLRKFRLNEVSCSSL